MQTYHHRRAGRLLAAAAAAALCALPLCALPGPLLRAQEAAATLAFDIPAQSLDSALAAFSSATRIQVVAPAEVTQGRQSPGLAGSYDPAAALGRLLAGTGLTYRFVNADTVTLSKVGESDGVMLSPITVAGESEQAASGSGYQGTPDWVYETPASVSVISREAIEMIPTRNARDLFDTVAGVYTNRSEGQNPGIAINIRGLQDQNRVVTMIDGARQNFQRNGHGTAQRTYVDTAFLREVDIEKSATDGVGGAGALGGSVDFRTIGADDLIAPGDWWGAAFDATTGTNEYEFQGSALAAVRLTDAIAVTAGVSNTTVGDYEIGRNGELEVSDLNYADGALVLTGQEVFSSIVKIEADVTDDIALSLGWLHYDADFSLGSYTLDEALDSDSERVVNDTATASLNWDPGSASIDLNARLWFNRTKNEEERWGSIVNDDGFPVNYGLKTFGGSLDNTSRLDTSAGTLSLNYGVEGFWDHGKTDTGWTYYTNQGDDFTASYTGMTPSGDRAVASAFGSATLEHDTWLTVTGGLRYDYYKLWGSTSIYGLETTTTRYCVLYFPDGVTCRIWRASTSTSYPETAVDVDSSEGAILPSATVALQPLDWLQPFVTYSRSLRPPTIMETFFSGGHPGVNIVQNAPNPDLVAERGNTVEIGVNIAQDGLLQPDDSVRFKAVGFNRWIKDYISLGEVYWGVTDRDYTAFVNVDGTTTMRGVEVEAAYDAGLWYAGVAYTYLDTDFADSYSFDGGSYPVEPSVIFVPPKTKITVDAGLRLLQQKLVLGGRMTHVGGTDPDTGLLVSSYILSDYTVFDIYSSYRVNDSIMLRAAATNVTDVAYVPALGTTSLPAPGRTVMVSLNLQF